MSGGLFRFPMRGPGDIAASGHVPEEVEVERENEEVQSGPVTHGGAGDPLGEGVAEPGENDASTTDEDEGGAES